MASYPSLLDRLDLDDVTGPGLDHGHRDRPCLVVEDLGHPQLLSEDGVHQLDLRLLTAQVERTTPR